MKPAELLLFWTQEGRPPVAEPSPLPFAIYSASQLLESAAEVAQIGARYLRSKEARERAREQGHGAEEVEALADRHDRARRRLEEARAVFGDVAQESFQLLGLTPQALLPETTKAPKPGRRDAAQAARRRA